MQIPRKFALLSLLLALLLVASACGSSEETTTTAATGGETTTTAAGGETTTTGAMAEGGPIWVLLPDSASSPRWETDDRRFFSEAFDAAGVEYNIVNAEGDAAVQQQQAEQAIAAGASVIVLVSLDPGSGGAIIDAAKAEGIPVLEYDRFNTGSSGGAVYVSFDNVKVGATMAEVLTPLIDALPVDTPQVVLLNGGDEDNNAHLFRDGYNATVEEKVSAGDWAVVDDQYVPGWGGAGEGVTIMEQILVAANNDVNAVFAANDNLAQQAITALQSAGLDPHGIPISGQDATAAGMQNIVLGLQAMSVYKPIEAEAKVAAAAALALRDGSDPTAIDLPEFQFTVIGIGSADGKPAALGGDGVVPYMALVPVGVTVDNITDTVIADGFRTVDEICTGDAASSDWCTENGG
jgi:D-xylose transport system substrate-binding protein